MWQPSQECGHLAAQVVRRLHSFHGILPYKITTSGEAIYFAYENPKIDAVLRVEVDNDLDVVSTLSIGRQVAESAILDGGAEELHICCRFNAG
jgi:hypothetical protein